MTSVWYLGGSGARVVYGRDSGIWKVNGSANTYTGDGTHPTSLTATAMAAVIPTATILSE